MLPTSPFFEDVNKSQIEDVYFPQNIIYTPAHPVTNTSVVVLSQGEQAGHPGGDDGGEQAEDDGGAGQHRQAGRGRWPD